MAQPTSFIASAHREQALCDLRNLSRAIDFRFKDQMSEIRA
jgi:hypothetical protein